MSLRFLVPCFLGGTALAPPAGWGPWGGSDEGDSSRWLLAGPGPAAQAGFPRWEGKRSGGPSRGQPAAAADPRAARPGLSSAVTPRGRDVIRP